MKKIKFLYFICPILLITFLFFPDNQPAKALEFDPDYIISDFEMQDYESMNLEGIQLFLNNKSGILKSYSCFDVDNQIKTAAEIIYNASQKHQISPKFLLVMLQKEQSLLTDSTPTEGSLNWAMGYGVCDDCDVDDPFVQLFKGFGKQVDRAAWRMRYYFNNASSEDWIKRANESYEIDDQLVIPLTQATANLYTYTPHLLGNKNFWSIWLDWFTKQYPDGSLVQEENSPGVWLIEHGSKRPFLSYAALVSRYNPKLIIKVPQGSLDSYEKGDPIKFAQYSLLMSNDGDIYLLVKDILRKIASPDVFKTLGFNPEEVIRIANSDVLMYQLGDVITNDSIYPTGALLQNSTTGGIYYVESGIKYPIATKDVLKLNFPDKNVISVSAEELDKYNTGAPIKLPDGLLVSPSDSTAVYVISNGEKRPILSGDVFEALGYSWENVIKVSKESLNNNAEGALIESDLSFASLSSINQ